MERGQQDEVPLHLHRPADSSFGVIITNDVCSGSSGETKEAQQCQNAGSTAQITQAVPGGSSFCRRLHPNLRIR